jgi:hypothetical protein
MPQLVKGGKYVYGWSVINVDGRIRIPDEAFYEYDFMMIEKIILMSGSKASGGLSISKPEAMGGSKMGPQIIDSAGYLKESRSFTTHKSEIIKSGGRLISWTVLDKGKNFYLSDELMDLLGLQTGSKLLVGRGSGRGPAFIAKGPIYEKAMKHKYLLVYH